MRSVASPISKMKVVDRSPFTPPRNAKPRKQSLSIAATSSNILVKPKKELKKEKSGGVTSLLPADDKDTIKSPILIFQDLFASIGTFTACFLVGLMMVSLEKRIRSLGSSSIWFVGIIRTIWRVWSWRSVEMLEELLDKTKWFQWIHVLLFIGTQNESKHSYLLSDVI